MQLSINFSLEEFLESDTAQRHNIIPQYNPDQKIIENLEHLCVSLLQPLRDLYGRPIKINSGWRHPELNDLVGGSKTSEHQWGICADITVGLLNGYLALVVLEHNLNFGQMILEKGTIKNPQWIHISSSKSKHKNDILHFDGVSYTRITKEDIIHNVFS